MFRRLALYGAVFALVVVVLGAWVRLSDAGLGCPDWPGCYGHLLGVPDAEHEVLQANDAFPERPVEAHKAWKEMTHRYFAGTLGLIVLWMSALAWRDRAKPEQPVILPMLLLGLVVFQAALGMWTVTLQLKPVIVMGHLLGGFSVLSCLWWLALSQWRVPGGTARIKILSPFVIVGIVVLILQIALGGWTSSNYAALACPDFPRCQTQWWPSNLNFSEAFVLWRGLGTNYEFGVLDSPARTAIHLTHRIGAVVAGITLVVVAILALLRLRQSRAVAWMVLGLLALQITLGISNVVFGLPLAVAAAHNGIAALLLLSMFTLLYVARQEEGRS